jgi:hypothetical protein
MTQNGFPGLEQNASDLQTLHRQLQIEKNDPHKRIGDAARCSGRFAVSATVVTHVILFMLNYRDKS